MSDGCNGACRGHGHIAFILLILCSTSMEVRKNGSLSCSELSMQHNINHGRVNLLII